MIQLAIAPKLTIRIKFHCNLMEFGKGVDINNTNLSAFGRMLMIINKCLAIIACTTVRRNLLRTVVIDTSFKCILEITYVRRNPRYHVCLLKINVQESCSFIGSGKHSKVHLWVDWKDIVHEPFIPWS